MEKPQNKMEPSTEGLAEDAKDQCEPNVGEKQTAIAAHPQGTEEEVHSQGPRAAPEDVRGEEAALKREDHKDSGACGSGSASAETLQDLSPSIHAPRSLLNQSDTTNQPCRTVDSLEQGEKHSQWSGRMNDFGNPLPAQNVALYRDSRESSSSTLASDGTGLGDIDYSTTSLPHAAWTAQGTLSDTNNQALKRATSKPPRPTSVPIATYAATSVRKFREGTEYPRYPDQSFAVLQSQHCPPISHPQPIRPRSSHPSQNSSFSAIPSHNSRDQIAMAPGAKTVGSTPAQSPGLFSPLFPSGRSQVEESEDSQTSTPLTHPAHLQTPKE